ncbi:MAG: Eco57I restriction-modification methylase domain-containing protein, partial [Actinomycetota bacterium]|nr:Eco57I restriction-modification methylase domain-containing protein [Actinomycetota bacterium]
DGLLGFIVPNKFMQADYGRGLRSLIAEQNSLHQVVDFRYAQVFERATTYTCLLFISGSANGKFIGSFNSGNETPLQFLSQSTAEGFPATELSAAAWSLAPSVESALLRKVEELGDPLPTLACLLS